MIVVDKQRYGSQEFQSHRGQISRLDGLCSPEDQLFAVCMKHPFDILSVILYLRDNAASVLLLNGESPLSAAISSAEQAGCAFLIYGERQEIVPLGSKYRPIRPSLFQFSSGTTGLPKLIQRSWSDIDLEIANYNKALSNCENETPLVLVPVYHSFGLIAGVLSALARDVEPVTVTEKNPKFTLHLIRSMQKSFVYAVPFLFHLTTAFPGDPVHFHKIISSGSPLSNGLLSNLKENSNEVWQQYGCSELGCISIGANPTSPSDVGKLLDHFSSPKTSHLESEEEITVLFMDKEYRTGDLGYFSSSGSLNILGRMDDLINVSGQKVIPNEVEDVIRLMPGVAEVVVYRMKHPVWGEAVKALVIVSFNNITEQEIKSWCSKRLPAYKVPRTIEFTTDIPRMPSGKISRKLLENKELE